MLTGYRVAGPELYRLGVVEACVPAADLLDAAMGLAAEIASKSPIATRLAKHALNTIEEMSLRDGYRFDPASESTRRHSVIVCDIPAIGAACFIAIHPEAMQTAVANQLCVGINAVCCHCITQDVLPAHSLRSSLRCIFS